MKHARDESKLLIFSVGKPKPVRIRREGKSVLGNHVKFKTRLKGIECEDVIGFPWLRKVPVAGFCDLCDEA